MIVRSTDPAELRAALVRAAENTGVDIAVEPAGLRRRAKRLVVLDVDSTLIRDEAIDVLARRAGAGTDVAAITARAMAGELDFAESLRARVALLAGLTDARIWTRSARRCGSPPARAPSSGRCTGWAVTSASSAAGSASSPTGSSTSSAWTSPPRTSSRSSTASSPAASSAPIIDRAGKAAALRRFAEEFGVPLAQTVAVGDGANDIDMLEAAGLGVAFNAKRAARDAADTAVNLPYLDTVLFVLGISGDVVAEAAT